MRDPHQRFRPSSIAFLGLAIGWVVGRVAPADADESAPPSAAPISPPEAAAESLTGQQVYNAVCIACHGPPGLGGAPALGDANAWAARIAQGKETLIEHALRGFSGSAGIMPRKGGRVDLSDEEIIGAVEYMVEQATRR